MSQSEILIDEDIFDYYTPLIQLALGERNPGAHTVVTKLFELIEKNETQKNVVINIIQILMTKNIIGARLWYIYKNESQMNIDEFIKLKLDQFTDEYFYEKFEKYTKNI